MCARFRTRRVGLSLIRVTWDPLSRTKPRSESLSRRKYRVAARISGLLRLAERNGIPCKGFYGLRFAGRFTWDCISSVKRPRPMTGLEISRPEICTAPLVKKKAREHYTGMFKIRALVVFSISNKSGRTNNLPITSLKKKKKKWTITSEWT